MKPAKTNKPWGSFIQFTHNEKSTVKILLVNPGEQLSLQSHQRREEFWYIIEGKPQCLAGRSKKKYSPGETLNIRRGVRHQLINPTKKPIRVLEISFGNFDEEDITRYKDKYGRAGTKR